MCCRVRYQLGKLSDIVARFSEPKALLATQLMATWDEDFAGK